MTESKPKTAPFDRVRHFEKIFGILRHELEEAPSWWPSTDPVVNKRSHIRSIIAILHSHIYTVGIDDKLIEPLISLSWAHEDADAGIPNPLLKACPRSSNAPRLPGQQVSDMAAAAASVWYLVKAGDKPIDGDDGVISKVASKTGFAKTKLKNLYYKITGEVASEEVMRHFKLMTRRAFDDPDDCRRWAKILMNGVIRNSL